MFHLQIEKHSLEVSFTAANLAVSALKLETKNTKNFDIAFNQKYQKF